MADFFPLDDNDPTAGLFEIGSPICSISRGAFGGKAQGLVQLNQVLEEEFPAEEFPGIKIYIPRMAVLCTDVFDQFMAQNQLYSIALDDLPDNRIGHAFQQAELPFNILGDLRKLIQETRYPQAVRSSSLLEDAAHEPFAGVYGTKIIPNNQLDANTRFRRLVEAIKFVYASLFFRSAKAYLKATNHELREEKMAVIIQDVVGKKFGSRYYPELSGVARSYNFYPMDKAKHEDGVVHLALGLGKTIVDGGISWSFSPARPKVKPPYRTVDELLKITQTRFWALNLGDPPAYDPLKETEYMVSADLTTAEQDGSLRYLASTFDPYANRLTIGTGSPGPRVLTFGRLLELNEIPLTRIISRLLDISESLLEAPVEIEFAMTFDPHEFGFLQVRPMVVSDLEVDLEPDELLGENLLLGSEQALGNGKDQSIQDIVFVKPDSFLPKYTRVIAQELSDLNRQLLDENRPYLLIVIGRLGTTDPWLGIPIDWGDVSGAKAVVETTTEDFNVVLSQGSHYFHNITSLGVYYFTHPFSSQFQLNWDWLFKQEITAETDHLSLVHIPEPLSIKVGGRHGRGIIQFSAGE